AIRWGTLAVALILATPDFAHRHWITGVWATLLVAYAAWRSFRPLTFKNGGLGSMSLLVLDLGIVVMAMVSTGYWQSPFIACMVTAVVAAGFAGGFNLAVPLALTAAISVTLSRALVEHATSGTDLRSAAQWGGELLLVALVAGYAKRVFGEAEE